MAKDYTTKTASIKATVGDFRNLRAKSFDSKEILLNGTDIQELWGFQDSKDFNELVKRYNLPTDEDYIIWTDSGNVAHMSFSEELTDGASLFKGTGINAWDIPTPALDNGQDMFANCTDLTGFQGDTSNLVNGSRMFNGCTSLSLFDSDLSSLRSGYEMFDNVLTTTETTEDSEEDVKMHTRCPLSVESIYKIAGWQGTIDDVKNYTFKGLYNALLDHANNPFPHFPPLATRGSDAGAEKSIANIYGLSKTTESNWTYNGGVIPSEERGVIYLGYPHDGMTDDEAKLLDVCFCYITGIKGWRLFIDGYEWNWDFNPKKKDIDDEDEKWHWWWWTIGGGGGGSTTGKVSVTDTNFSRAYSQIEDLRGTADKYKIVADDLIKNGAIIITFGNSWYDSGAPLRTVSSVERVYKKHVYDNEGCFSNMNLQHFNSCIKNLSYGSYMFANSGLITFKTEYVPTDATIYSLASGLPKLKRANHMFDNCTKLTTFFETETITDAATQQSIIVLKETDADMLLQLKEANYMFRNCENMTHFIGKMPNLKKANYMFYDCLALSNFDIYHTSTSANHTDYYNLDNLEEADGMFHNAPITGDRGKTGNEEYKGKKGDTTWRTSLPSLKSGKKMFFNTKIVNWHAHMDRLKVNEDMFAECELLETFYGRLPNITKSDGMFYNCPKLTTFTSRLPKLRYAIQMFENCSLLTEFIIMKSDKLDSLHDGTMMFKNSGLKQWQKFIGDHDLELWTYDGKLNLPKLQIATEMFAGCTSLTIFEGDMNMFNQDDAFMFNGCTALKLFKGNLPALQNPSNLFAQKAVTETETASETGTSSAATLDAFETFSGNLNSAISTSFMFYNKCPNIKTFSTENVEKVKTADGMFMETALTTFNCKSMPSLESAKSMFSKNSGTPSAGILEFTCETPKLADGTHMFSSVQNFKSFNGNLSSLTTGDYMFYQTQLTDFNCKSLDNLTSGIYMFAGVSSLESFNVDMPKLDKNDNMFKNCTNLKTFNADLDSITNANNMFDGCANLTTFKGNLKNLSIGDNFFKDNVNLQSFSTNTLVNMRSGVSMFQNCSSLNSFILYGDVKNLDRVNIRDLSNMTNGTDMFNGCSNLRVFLKTDLSSLQNGTRMFYDANLASFNSDMPELTDATDMFAYNKNLASFTSSIPKLTQSLRMFSRCSSLTSFNGGNMAYLKNDATNRSGMFNECNNLSSFTAELPALKSGYNFFFNCFKLSSFNCSTLESMTDGFQMFGLCKSLSRFNCKLDELTNGDSMFHGCSALTDFYSGEDGLKKLQSGNTMFMNCDLNASSVEHILNNIPNISTGKRLTIGMQKSAEGVITSKIGGLVAQPEPGWPQSARLKVQGVDADGNPVVDENGNPVYVNPTYKGWELDIFIGHYYDV